MTPLSIDLRRRVVDAYLSGKTSTYEETAELFGIGEATVSRLLSLYRSTGVVAPKKMGGNNPRKINLDWLVEHATKNPDARAVDRVRDWAEVSGVTVSLSCMYASLHENGWSHKKTPTARERRRPDVEQKRALFVLKQPHLDPRRLVFLDESGFRRVARFFWLSCNSSSFNTYARMTSWLWTTSKLTETPMCSRAFVQ